MSRPAPQVRTYGFAKGNSPNDVAAIIAEALRKAAEWNEPIIGTSTDVLTAFDKMQHGPLDKANEFMQVPIEARIAAMRDYEGKTAQLTIPGAGTSNTFPLKQSGGQGGVRTPDEFNNMMRCILMELVSFWEELGIGYGYNGRTGGKHMLNHLLWADNIFLLGTSTEEIQHMLDMITGRLNQFGFQWKPNDDHNDNMFIMTGGSKVNETKKVEVCTEEGIQELKLVESIMILGNEIDKVGNGFVSMRHRLRKTEKGFGNIRKP